MAMKNYRLVDKIGQETFQQFDDTEELGKAMLKALRDAVDDPDNLLAKFEPGEPEPIN